MLTLITPTGDRPEAFALCEHWMSRQTRQDFEWIVVDDGREPTRPTLGQKYVRRPPKKHDPRHTLGVNLTEGLKHVKGNKILIIEDDDYYAPRYLETMAGWLGKADLVGEVGARYYYLPQKAWRHWPNHEHASLCRTGFTRAVLPTLKRVLAKLRDWRIDLNLWQRWTGSKHKERRDANGPALCVGIKGLPGRRGVTWSVLADSVSDPDLSKLWEWCGADAASYLPFVFDDPVIVYVALFGGYDQLPVPCPDERVRYVAFTDNPAAVPAGWEAIRVPVTERTPQRENRKWKILGHRWFPFAKWTVYQDACLQFQKPPSQLVEECAKTRGRLFCTAHAQRDCLYAEADCCSRWGFDDKRTIAAQLARYRAQGVPGHLGLAWCGLIVRRGCEEHGERWWREVSQGSVRDQISFPVACLETETDWTAIPGTPPYDGLKNPWVKRVDHKIPRKAARGKSRSRL